MTRMIVAALAAVLLLATVGTVGAHAQLVESEIEDYAPTSPRRSARRRRSPAR